MTKRFWRPFEEILKEANINDIMVQAVRQEELGYGKPILCDNLTIALVKGFKVDKIELTEELLLIHNKGKLYAVPLEVMDNSELQGALNDGDISFLPYLPDFDRIMELGKDGLICPNCKSEDRSFTVKQTCRSAYMVDGETAEFDSEDVEDMPLDEKKLVCSECESEYKMAIVNHRGKDYVVPLFAPLW